MTELQFHCSKLVKILYIIVLTIIVVQVLYCLNGSFYTFNHLRAVAVRALSYSFQVSNSFRGFYSWPVLVVYRVL